MDLNALNSQIQGLQSTIDQLGRMQQQFNNPQAQQPTPVQSQTIVPSTYPRIIRQDTVEDILNNPEWKQQLGNEFAASDLGQQARSNTEILFMQFCERQTGKNSIMLDNMRANMQQSASQESQIAKNKGGNKDGQNSNKDIKNSSKTDS